MSSPDPGWTLETLRIFVEARIDAEVYRNDMGHAAITNAIAAAATELDRRFGSVNEFRAVLSDQALTFMPRTEAMARADANQHRIDVLSSRVDVLEGRSAGESHTTALFLTLGGLILSVVTILVTVIILK